MQLDLLMFVHIKITPFNAPKEHVLKLFCACVESGSSAPNEHQRCLFVTMLILRCALYIVLADM